MSDKPKTQWVHEQRCKFQMMCAREVLRETLADIGPLRAMHLLEETYGREALRLAAQSYLIAEEMLDGFRSFLTNPGVVKKGDPE